MKRKLREYFFENTAEMIIWKKFVKYNRVKYCFIYMMGILTGVMFLSIVIAKWGV